jgi:hypothetical protein
MIRPAMLMCFVLAAFSIRAQADDRTPFSVTSEATRSGDQISVSLKIVENKIESVPNVGNTNVTTTMSSPRIKMRDGQQAMLSVGRSSADSGAHSTTRPGDMDSGIRVDVISIKGQDKVLVVTSVVEDGSTVWADAATVLVRSKSAADKQ